MRGFLGSGETNGPMDKHIVSSAARIFRNLFLSIADKVSVEKIVGPVFFVFILVSLYSIGNDGIRWLLHPFPGWHRPDRRPSNGLKPTVLQALPVVVYTDRGDEEATIECAVCLSEFEEGEILRRIPWCGHRFHAECIDTWFCAHSTCPICRCRCTGDPTRRRWLFVSCNQIKQWFRRTRGYLRRN